MSDLIDTTQMYLRTLFELFEEGVPPLRARIAERLHQSGPTVSQTVARMERDGLLVVEDDRHVAFTPAGQQLAMRVMRRHRLAERMLVDVIGLDWELVHEEACRWEHVMSEEVEKRLVQLLDKPTTSPYGNPIPGLHELGVVATVPAFRHGNDPLTAVMDRFERDKPVAVTVLRLGEALQAAETGLGGLLSAKIAPGSKVQVSSRDGGYVLEGESGTCKLSHDLAAHVFVARA